MHVLWRGTCTHVCVTMLSLSLSLSHTHTLTLALTQSLRELVVGNLQRVNALGSVNYPNAPPPSNPTN